MLDIEVSLEGLKSPWSPGQSLVDVLITLGQNEKSSSCQVTLSDPKREIADALIKHSLKSGGLSGLPDSSVVAPSANTPTNTTSNTSNTGVVARGQGMTPVRMAFLDVLALKEVGGYFPGGFSEAWYYVYYSGGVSPGTFSKEEASRGFPLSVGNKASGRYQFFNSTWRDINTRLKGGFKDFLPESQDRAAIVYLKDTNGALGRLDAGDIQGAIVAARPRWVSLPGGSQDGWGSDGMNKALKYFNERLRYYQGDSIGQPVQVPKTIPHATDTTDTTTIKGNRLTVSWGKYSFEFYHQGTETSDQGLTTLTGQGVRWVASRRKRNTTHKNLSLKQLAQKIADSYSLKLDWQASYDPLYSHVDQTGITDYQLLHREAAYAGLFVTEGNGAIAVKSRDKIRDTGYVISQSENLISYQITDVPKDKNSQDISGLLQEEPKAQVDPISGTTKVMNPDVDPSKSQGVTGSQQQPIAGIPAPGQDGQINQQRARTQRIKGLPSTFVLPIDDETLALRPLDAVRTKGISTTLDRIWMINSVTWSSSNMLCTLSCFSPVDTFVAANAPETTPGTVTGEEAKDWVYPMTGTVTSLFGMRRGRMHRGTDIGSSNGRGVIYSVASGVAFIKANGCQLGDGSCGGGFGNWVEVDHGNGYKTRYAHMTSIGITNGQKVSRGQPIGIEGNTGASRGNHLHFEVVRNGERIDPGTLFPKFRTVLSSIIALSPV